MNRRLVAGVVMAVAAMVVMTKGERLVECEEEEVNKMQDNFINCTQHFKQEYNVQVCNKHLIFVGFLFLLALD